MILPIYIYGNSVLREKAKEIAPDYPKLKELIADMYETMYASEGVGLAAPQIGLPIRLFVVDATVMNDEFPEVKDFKKVFINAQILSEEGEEWYYNEGCLSIPFVREDILRKSIIKVRYCDESFVEHIETFDGLRARIIQHEYDHIEGKLIIDHISPIKRRLLKNKLHQIATGQLKPKYKVILPKKL
ncbi:MAG: peptide deformylase [Bacteroidales bacterium]|nr:peptide deformylase [Bacteroidales bacterium]